MEDAARSAYAAVLRDMVEECGQPSTLHVPSQGATYANGVGFAKLLDMDGDGVSELLVAYASPSVVFGSGCNTFEVWHFDGDEAVCDYSGALGGHGTNGYWPYIEVYQRSDGLGCAYMLHGCVGSSPATYTEELWGYRNGSLVSLGRRAIQNAAGARGRTSYYSDYSARTGVRGEDETSESEYAQIFLPYMSESDASPPAHAHLYSTSYDIACDYDYLALEEVVADAVETLQELGVVEGSPSFSDVQPMYRLYNPNSGEHFYTAYVGERDDVVAAGWRDEGIGWTAPEISSSPVYRLYNEFAGEHHYTMDMQERNSLVEIGWTSEGVGWFSDDAQTVPLLREYNPNEFANNHNYTASADEHANLISLGWRDEGIAWYGTDASGSGSEIAIQADTDHYQIRIPEGWPKAYGGAIAYEVDESLTAASGESWLGYGCVSTFHIGSGDIYVGCFTSYWGPQGSYAYKKVGTSLSSPAWDVYVYTYHDYSLEASNENDVSAYLDEFAAFVVAGASMLDDEFLDGLGKDGP